MEDDYKNGEQLLKSKIKVIADRNERFSAILKEIAMLRKTIREMMQQQSYIDFNKENK